jgi:hypothetical protein
LRIQIVETPIIGTKVIGPNCHVCDLSGKNVKGTQSKPSGFALVLLTSFRLGALPLKW